MIQFNLLPDVKIEYIRTQRMKRSVLMLSIVISGVSVAFLVLLFLTVRVAQPRHMANLQKDVEAGVKTLKATEDINKILTIQNQLNVLNGLHDNKPVASRTFDYIKQVTPKDVRITNLRLDFDANTITIQGRADSISAVNTYVDTLKFTKYSATEDEKTVEAQAFSEVVLGSYSVSDKGATYQISLKYNPDIFIIAKKVTLTVPTQTTTRSETEKPSVLFENKEAQ